MNMQSFGLTLPHPAQPAVLSASGPVRIGLVIPSYGYANFLPEMASGILAQQVSVPFRCVLVDDGEDDANLIQTCTTYAAAYPDIFAYLRPRQNGGLSAARNAGAAYLLAQYPDIDMIMFPDADDRMLAGFVQRSYDAFIAARDRAASKGQKLGWVFENPNIFGEPGDMTRVTKHAVIWNMVGATQMPSSALSADMYRSGLRYDETMVWGGEDWDFSIRALQQGYTASFIQHQGFHWRRRPGSMSSAQSQNTAREHNRALIRSRNKPLFARSSVWAMLARENPGHCLITDRGVGQTGSPTALAALMRRPHTPLTTRDLAKQLNNSLTYPCDPCPQSMWFLARGVNMARMTSPAQAEQIALMTEFLLAQDYIVSHNFAPFAQARVGQMPQVTYEQPNHADVVAMTRERLLRRVQGDSFDTPAHITLLWPRHVPETRSLLARARRYLRRNQAPFDAHDMPDPFARDMVAAGLNNTPPDRFRRTLWQPQGLGWRSVAAFHLEVKHQHLHDAAYLGRRAVVVHASDLPACLDQIDTGTGRAPDLIVSGPIPHMLMDRLDAAHRAGRIGQVTPADLIPEHGAAVPAFVLNLLGLYHEVIHWNRLDLVDHLGALAKIGVKNRLVFADIAALDAQFGDVSATFKCYNSYHIISADIGDLRAAMGLRGIADELAAQGNPFDTLHDPVTTDIHHKDPMHP